MRNFFKIFLFILGLISTAQAQQDAMYSQYVFNMMAINPAYTGNRNAISASAFYRSQWSGIDGAPRTGNVTVQSPLNGERMGLGIQVFDDRLGITSTTGAIGSYAYHLTLNNEAKLSFGLQASAMQYKANYGSVDLGSGAAIDPAFSQNVSKTIANAGAGAFYHTEKFYAGLSALDLLPNKLNENTELSARQVPHFFFTTGYVFPVGEDFKFKPSVLVKAVKGAPVEGDIQATFWIKDFISVGGLYRTNADVSGLLGIQVSPQFYLGYAYDASTTALKRFNSGSHEIMIRYEFSFDRNKILSPRFF
ncbi:hypothetical protein C7T94_12475 [Pedobacter yulinensis]|uniref:Type IX secretion system membrane protein PorP/SprF n=1 Tax=Pedobacter yulinensis TaxID=2126353 RepID=A0A2T3HLR9_9SPHI|nr:type IX secretion system membrane protein PorP/SprF [Pedobacter yulinensis]PST83385.1 hypothetical protein C7T94_12475 [Pedobacter yulinensis]